jgi:hypothetical protein
MKSRFLKCSRLLRKNNIHRIPNEESPSWQWQQ